MSSVFQLTNQQFPKMFKSPHGENGIPPPRVVGGGNNAGHKVVCTPEVSLYQYTSPDMASTTGAGTTPSSNNPLTRLIDEKSVGVVEQSNGNIAGVDGNVSVNGGFQCAFCGKTFQQKNTFQNHLRSHREGEDPYQCDICGKTFAVPARLTRHYRTHTGEKPYQCEYCNKSFSVKENLSVHRRIHTKERPYKCEVCERAFEHSGKLHRHMRIHTGERPHRCHICQKTFIQSGQLVIHMRTHTGEKPYVCKTCGKGFTCSKQLKVHTRTHTGEKPYTCDICGKSFGYNHVLKLHQVAHYGEKVYKCTLCNGTFNSKKALETHIKTHSDDHVPLGAESPRIATDPGVLSPPSRSQPTPQSQNSDKENRECSDSELSSQNSPSSNDGPKTPPSPAMHFTSPSSSGAINSSTSSGNIGGSQHHHQSFLASSPAVDKTGHGGFNRVSGNNSTNQSSFTDSSSSSGSSNNNNSNSSQDKTCSTLPIPYPMLPPGVQIQQAPHSRTTFLYVTSKLPSLNNNSTSNSNCLSDSSPPVSPPLNGVVRQSHHSPLNNPSGFVGHANNNINSNANKYTNQSKGGNNNVSSDGSTNARDKMLMYNISERVLAFTEKFGYGLGPEEQQHAQNSKRFVDNGNVRYIHRQSSSSSNSSAVSVHPIMVPENLSFNNNSKTSYSDERNSSTMYHQSRLRHHQQQQLNRRDRSPSPDLILPDQMPRQGGYTPGGVLALALTKGSKAVAAAAAAASHNIPAKVSVFPVNSPMSNGSNSSLFTGFSTHQQQMANRLSPPSSGPGSPIDFHMQQQLHHQNSIYASSRGSLSPNRNSLHSPSPNSTPRSTPSLHEDYSDPVEMKLLSSSNSNHGELSSDENSSTSNSSSSSAVATKRARSPNSNSNGSGGGPRKRSSLILEKYAMENPSSPATPPNSESILSQRLRLSSVIQYAEKCS